MRVRLIPTGQAELGGLGSGLSRLFPGHTFETVPQRVDPDRSKVPFDSFTSARLRPSLMPGNLKKLVEQLAAEVYPGRKGDPADLAVLIDDLELENADQPALVVAAVQAAVREHLEDLARISGARMADRVSEALRSRASFHLAAPMIEAWFYADNESLKTASVPETRLPPLLREGIDLEAFETNDPAFSADDGSGCTELKARNARRPNQKPERACWVLPSRPDLPAYCRERHPKAYLAWLCRDPGHRRCSTYQESKHGAAALASLNWSALLSNPSGCTWARALVQDLAEALGSPVTPFPEGSEQPLVSRAAATSPRVLRNV
ncbi:MAG TPA: hypothetical protein VE093_35975 [Polyangiaceae bacterium]|nr:hypothetical protein [Polyangiaceae bacterium]